ncbi:MAG: DUF3024 domain-containing protein [Salinivirgaceae bacterium]|jgi:hypothetical protein|nr:DUF3024 domain-containing protein [Salinivirgaceae bacterium]
MTKEGQIINIFEKQIKEALEEMRPPVELREQVDIHFEFENNTLEILEVRPSWKNPDKKTKTPVSKAKYIKSRGVWSIYWMRASGNWEKYEPKTMVNNLSEFFEVLKEDQYGCFFG